MNPLLLFLFLLLAISLCWRWIRPWLLRRAQNKVEDFFRKQMGMPSRKEEHRQQKKEKKAYSRTYSHSSSSRASRGFSDRNDSLIPPEYAEDVEFVEFKEFSQTDIHQSDSESAKTIVENQVEDAEYTDLK